MNTRGSEWRKWDLHIHSLASDGSSSCLEIVKVSIEKGLSAIALTDHHTAKNIDEIKEIGQKLGLSVISGIEFRTEYGDKSVHLIGLFPDQYNGIMLNTKSLTELILNPLGLSETIIISKGKESKPGINNEQAFKEGMFLVQVDFKKAANLIHDNGGLVIVHNGSKENGLDAEMKHQGSSERNVKTLYASLGTVKEELFLKGYIDICEIRKENDDENFYLTKFCKPSIIASDAHSASEIGSKYVWIKADTTFDGLRQIVFEPESRVRISGDMPEKKNDYLVIDRVNLKHNDFGNQIIYINKNLTSIIGGRSSGKSILLGAIAKKIGTDKDVKADKPEYNNYIENSIVPVIDVQWCDGVIDTSRKIDYFPQTYINTLAANSFEVVTLIESIIKMDLKKKTLLEAFSSNNIRRRTDINNAISEYFQGMSGIDEIKSEILALGSKDGIKKQVEKLEKEIKDIKDKMEASLEKYEEERYSDQCKEIDTLRASIIMLSNEISVLESYKSIIHFESISSNLSNLTQETSLLLNEYYKLLIEELKEKWKIKITEIIEKDESNKIKWQDNIIDIETDTNYLKCKKYYSENKAYIETESKLKEEKKRYDVIEVKEKELENIQKEQLTKKNEIIQLHNGYYLNCQEISSQINYTKEDVEIICSVQFNSKKFNQTLSERFNQRAFEIQALVNYKYVNNDEYISFIDTIYDRIVNVSIQLKAGATIQQAIIDIIANSYYDIGYDVIYEKDSLSQMSEGKKAFIIMRMLLDFNENGYPILIDQPEDDLDNRAIYDEMVKYIRRKKIQRQIIIVTHNPNIVVGADSELVICANQDGVGNKNDSSIKFEYYGGSLEYSKDREKCPCILNSQGIREHVCDILEGGNEAFLKRELKYRIKKK